MPLLQPFRFALALAGASLLSLPAALPARAELSGAYLAARSADFSADYAEGAIWLGRALEQDPTNATLLESLVMAYVGTGETERAVPVAERLIALGQAAPVTETILVADKFRARKFDELLSDLAGTAEGPGSLVNQLLLAWAQIGAGRMGEAIAGFDTLGNAQAMAIFGQYHKALALGMAGDFEGAEVLLSNEKNALMSTRRATIAHVQVLTQLDRFDDAVALVDAAFGGGGDPEILALREKLVAREVLPFSTVTSAVDGAAEVFHLLSLIMQGEAPDAQTLVQSRVAEFLRPDHSDATLLSAQVLESLDQAELAIASYDRIPSGDPASFVAQSARVMALYRLDRKTEAVQAMMALAAANPRFAASHVALGDLLRREERYGEAAAAYSRAIELVGKPDERHWQLFFSRGIAWEQAKEFGKAEPDFRRALELNPGQPDVLNYLGYSLLDRNLKIPEALGMIEEAVKKRPRDGHIIDSLAWGLFLTGRFEEAVQHMEAASLLMAVDPIVTDHLGDVYWAVGRKTEARFQWRRALSFEPSEKDAARIRRKLEIGLDDVLKEEKMPSLDARRSE